MILRQFIKSQLIYKEIQYVKSYTLQAIYSLYAILFLFLCWTCLRHVLHNITIYLFVQTMTSTTEKLKNFRIFSVISDHLSPLPVSTPVHIWLTPPPPLSVRTQALKMIRNFSAKIRLQISPTPPSKKTTRKKATRSNVSGN